jgi:hypothetical protein
MTGMWACPSCGRSFANRNQVHTCAALGDLDRHFTGTADSPPAGPTAPGAPAAPGTGSGGCWGSGRG